MNEPSLERLRVAKPCPAAWNDMAGDDRVRFCGLCRRDVYNLSALTTAEALDLLRSRSEGICGLLYRRKDGTVITADCPVGKRAALARASRRLVGTAAALLLVFGGRFLTPQFKQRCHDLRRNPAATALTDKEEEEREMLRSLGYLS